MYVYIRALHILGVVLWFGALLQVSRLLKTHARAPEEARETLSDIERRTHLFVGWPGLILTATTGLLLLTRSGMFAEYMKLGWFHAKLTAVILAVGVDIAVFLTIRAYRSQPVGILKPLCLHIGAGILLIAVLVLVKVNQG